MSRTDKTNPYFVKWFYEPMYLEEQHRHYYHECNLPRKPRTGEVHSLRWYSWDGPCFWWPSLYFYRSKDARCPCPMCGWDYYETPRRKRERIEARRYCRDGWRDEY